jgi:hypothetical protein
MDTKTPFYSSHHKTIRHIFPQYKGLDETETLQLKKLSE